MAKTADSEGKIKFWAILAIIILAVAIAVTLIDMSIKTAILAESNSLKQLIDGQRTKRSNQIRVDTDSADNSPVPDDVLDIDTARVEARNVRDRDKTSTQSRPGTGPNAS